MITPYSSNVWSCGTSGAEAGLPASITAAQVLVATANWRAFQPGSPREPGTVMLGAKCAPALNVVVDQSTQ